MLPQLLLPLPRLLLLLLLLLLVILLVQTATTTTTATTATGTNSGNNTMSSASTTATTTTHLGLEFTVIFSTKLSVQQRLHIVATSTDNWLVSGGFLKIHLPATQLQTTGK